MRRALKKDTIVGPGSLGEANCRHIMAAVRSLVGRRLAAVRLNWTATEVEDLTQPANRIAVLREVRALDKRRINEDSSVFITVRLPSLDGKTEYDYKATVISADVGFLVANDDVTIDPHADPKLAATFHEWVLRSYVENLKAEAVITQVRRALDLCSTTKQLTKAWPRLLRLLSIRWADSEDGRNGRTPHGFGPAFENARANADTYLAGCQLLAEPTAMPDNHVSASVSCPEQVIKEPWTGAHLEP